MHVSMESFVLRSTYSTPQKTEQRKLALITRKRILAHKYIVLISHGRPLYGKIESRGVQEH